MPPDRAEFQIIYDTGPHVPTEEEVIRLPIGDRDRIEARKFPKVALGVSEVEELLAEEPEDVENPNANEEAPSCAEHGETVELG